MIVPACCELPQLCCLGLAGGLGGGDGGKELHGLQWQSVLMQGGVGICGLQEQPHRWLLFGFIMKGSFLRTEGSNYIYEKNEKRFLNMILQGCHTCLGCHIGYITKQNKRRFQICVDVIAIDVELVTDAAGIADADANALVYAIVQE